MDAQEVNNKAEARNRKTLIMQYNLVSEGNLRKTKEIIQDNLFLNKRAIFMKHKPE
jgi:hypothetical protein